MSRTLKKLIIGQTQISTEFMDKCVQILDKLCYFEFMQYSDAYKQTLAGMLEAAKSDLENLERQRVKLQASIEETDSSIAARRQEIGQFEAIWQRATSEEKPENELLPLTHETSFTAAIAYVLRRANRSLSPTEIRDRLVELGYDTSIYKSDVVASIHTTLRRFLASTPPKVEETGEGRRRNYRWVLEARRTPGLEIGVGNEAARTS